LKTDKFASIQRRSILNIILVVSAAILVFRLFQMQILEQEVYEIKASDNSVKNIEMIPLRGRLLDRNGEIIVSNKPAYTLRITPIDYDTKLNPMLEAVMELPDGYINELIKKNKIYSRYLPLRVKRDVDFRVVAWLEENSEKLPGVDYVIEMQRDYPAGISGSHMFGYTKEISPSQLEKEDEYYKPGDYVGHTGIEKYYEKYLRGIKGNKFLIVNSKRKVIGRYKNGAEDINADKGDDLILSIDADAQRVAEQEFKGMRGALVAIEPKTGEVLALVSAPEYDLKMFSYVTPKEFLDSLYNNPEKPLFNRATMSVKPPGSTFKIMEAIAALDLGVINTNTTFFCNGGFTYGRFFKCHGVHGSVNVVHAIEKSCNTFFYNLIYKIGLDRWKNYATKFGFGMDTNIDIGEEVPGLIPDEKYYENIYGPDWPKSIMASLGIGQGEVGVTPLQLAQYVSLIASDGKTFSPHIVKGYRKENETEIHKFKFAPIDLGIKKEVFDIVKEGMFLVVQGNGTATHIRTDEFTIAGKTGTAQNPHGKDHALFIAYAPADNPQIAIAVVVENVGFGATYAAPIAKKVMEAYLLKHKITPELQNQKIAESKNQKEIVPVAN
jgi:penicillin-binding protein 2